MTKIRINISELNKDLLTNYNDAINHLNKSLELYYEIIVPPDYMYKEEIKKLGKQLEIVRNNLRDYYQSYNNAAIHFDNINNDLLQQIKNFKNINIYKK